MMGLRLGLSLPGGKCSFDNRAASSELSTAHAI